MTAVLFRRALLVVVLAVSCIGRGSERSTQPLWSADPASDDNPFPDERLVDDSGRFAPPEGFAFRFMPSAAVTSYADVTFAAWADFVVEAGGWGVAAPVALRFSAPLDAAALRPGALAFVLVTPSTSEGAASVIARVDATLRWITDPGYLLATPATPLPSSSRVLVAVRRDLAGALPLARSEAFSAHAGGVGRTDVEAAALALGVSGSELALVFAYRTASPASEMRRALQLVIDAVPPFSFTAAVGPGDLLGELAERARDLPEGVRVAVGAFQSLDLRPVHSDRVGWAAGVWDLETAPAPAELALLYALPDAATFPPPWPAVIIQHGFAGDRTFGLDVAEAYLARGMAVFAIDASSHGERGSFLGFLRVDDPRVARDHLRQTIIDVAQLATLLRSGAIDVDGVPGSDLDGTLLLYGHSMGTFVVFPLVTVDDRFEVAALNAPGASFTTLFQGPRLKAAVALLLRPALGLTIDDPAYEDALPFCAAVVQTLMEAADPLAYVEGRVPALPPLLFQMNLGDRTLPNEGTLSLTGALGMDAVDSPVDDGDARDVLWLLDPATFAFPAQDDPHGMHSFAPGIHIQTAEFLASHGRRLTDPLTPIE